MYIYLDFQSVEIPVAQGPESQVSAPPPISVPSPTTGGALTVEQRAKLQSELDVVQSNMSVFAEMLNEMKPGNAQPDEIELLQVSLLLLTPFYVLIRSNSA